MKENLGLEENNSVERAHSTGKIQRNDGTNNKNRTIIVKFINFKCKPRILERNETMERENHCKREFFGGDSQLS